MLTELDKENTTLKKTPGKKRPDDINLPPSTMIWMNGSLLTGRG